MGCRVILLHRAATASKFCLGISEVGQMVAAEVRSVTARGDKIHISMPVTSPEAAGATAPQLEMVRSMLAAAPAGLARRTFTPI